MTVSSSDGPGTVVVERLEDGTLRARARDVAIPVGRVADDALESVELLLAALGTCTVGTMLAFAAHEDIALDGVRLELRPVLASAPARVAEIRMTMHVDGTVEERRLASLRRVAEHCKVHTTLRRAPSLFLTLEHGDQATWDAPA